MNTSYKILPLLISSMFLFSCQTDETKEVQTEVETTPVESVISTYDFNVEVKNDMLSFETRADYDDAIAFLGPLQSEAFAEWESSLGFNKSMRNSLSIEEREEQGVYDDLLATLINKDAMIEIAGNVFKINPADETVIMFSSNSDTQSSKGARVFSTNDNVLDIIDGTDVPESTTNTTSAKTLKKFCGREKVGTLENNDFGEEVSWKIVYQKAGILNSLVANLKKKSFGGPIQLNLSTDGDNFWRNKKESRTISSYSDGGNKREYDYRPYHRSRRLKDFNFKMRIYFYSVTQTGSFDRTFEIGCDR